MRSGDINLAIRELGKLEALITDLANVPRKVARLAAPRISRLLQREFSQGQNPYGRKWAKLANGKRAHLTKSGRLRAGTSAYPSTTGIRIVLGASYGVFHQLGTRNMPARRILPQFGLPAEWQKALDMSAREAFKQTVARAR